MTYVSSKTYGHEIGLSCAFRQWRAESHCRLIHGYALAVRIEFQAEELDHRNWVIDFGSLKGVKQHLENMFDHVLLVAEDDPQRAMLENLDTSGVANVRIVKATGCEAFAEEIWEVVNRWLFTMDYGKRVICRSVEVREHGANSAIYEVPIEGIPVRTADLKVARTLTQDTPS